MMRSLSRRSGSSGGEPIMNDPAGITIMSGQFRHSLNVSPGLDASVDARGAAR
jgi:hypothetical protein